MNKINSLYDKISLYEIYLLFCDKYKPRTDFSRKEFLRTLLNDCIIMCNGETNPNSALENIDKYLSKNTSGSTLILEDMRNLIRQPDREFILQLKKGCTDLANEITDPEDAKNIYKLLLESCNNINFPTQYLNIAKKYETICSLENRNTELEGDFLLPLIAHAIENYDISSPKFYCNRLYYESLTLEHRSKTKKRLLKEIVEVAANSNTKSVISAEAAVQYGNLIYNDYEEAYKYFLIASEKLPSAYWEIGYLIEEHRLNNQTVINFEEIIDRKSKEPCNNTKKNNDAIRFDIKYTTVEKDNSYILTMKISQILNNNEKSIETRKFLFDYGSKEENYDLLVSFKNYFFIAQKLNFTKGWNSIGKYLLQGKAILLTDNEKKDEDGSINLMMKYFQKAMALGNINAMVNLGSFYYQKFEKGLLPDNEKTIMLNMLENAADIFLEPKACELLGNYYYKLGELDNAKKYYQNSLSEPVKDNYRHYMLGKIYKDKMDYENAIGEFQIAISAGYYDAAYECIIIWYEKAITGTDENMKQINLHLCNEYYKRYIKLIKDDEIIEKMTALSELIFSFLDKNTTISLKKL